MCFKVSIILLRLSRRKLPKKKREKGDFIAVYRASKGLENINRDNLFVWDDKNTTDTRRNRKGLHARET